MGYKLPLSRNLGPRAARRAVASLLAVALPLGLCTAAGGAAQASPNLVVDGGFADTTLSGSYELGSWSYNSQNYTDNLTYWTVASGSYNYVFTSGSATALGSYGNFTLSNGAAIANSPAGGNFISADGNFGVGAISQTINGLTVGAKTTLTFYWAAAQQTGYTGATSEYWQASLGSATQDTATYNLAQGAFSGWMQATMTFIPTSTSEVLSFLAFGTGSPPMLLLDGVTLAAPEPSTWAILVTGLVGLGVAARRRRRAASSRGAAA
jgi:hypothetical protein